MYVIDFYFVKFPKNNDTKNFICIIIYLISLTVFILKITKTSNCNNI